MVQTEASRAEAGMARSADEPAAVRGGGSRRVYAIGLALLGSVLAAAAVVVLSGGRGGAGAVEELGQDSLPSGKFYYMKMLRNQVPLPSEEGTEHLQIFSNGTPSDRFLKNISRDVPFKTSLEMF